MVPINYWAVLVCAVVSMMIGMAWFGPIFGKQWVVMMGFKKEDMERAQKEGMGKTYAIAFVNSLVMAYVLAHSIVFASAYLHISGVNAGLQGGFWSWLGFVMTVHVGEVIWDGKRKKLAALTAGYYLVTLCVEGVILALWV